MHHCSHNTVSWSAHPRQGLQLAVINQAGLDFDAAETLCFGEGAKPLLTISSKAELATVASLLPPSSRAWVGAHTSGKDLPSINDKTSWKWSSGTTVDPTLWSSGQPSSSNIQNPDRCVCVYVIGVYVKPYCVYDMYCMCVCGLYSHLVHWFTYGSN